MASRDRISKDAGWRDSSKLPRGPNGRALCRRCQAEVPKGRRAWCGEACIHDHRIESDPGYARACVEERDEGVCVLCGFDTEAANRAYQTERHRLYTAERAWEERYPWRSLDHCHKDRWSQADCDYHRMARRISAAFRRLRGRLDDKLGRVLGRRHRWEMDHIKPVVEGGGSCGLDNLRTLCIACHKHETKLLAGRRAAARKTQLILSLADD